MLPTVPTHSKAKSFSQCVCTWGRIENASSWALSCKPGIIFKLSRKINQLSCHLASLQVWSAHVNNSTFASWVLSSLGNWKRNLGIWYSVADCHNTTGQSGGSENKMLCWLSEQVCLSSPFIARRGPGDCLGYCLLIQWILNWKFSMALST